MLRVGAIDASHWMRAPAGDEGSVGAGVEGRLLERYAHSLGVTIEWTEGGAEDLVDALRSHRLDVVAGGLTDSNPWKQHVGFTRPYHRSRGLVGVPEGTASSDLFGLRVAVRKGTVLHAWLRDEGALVVALDDPRGFGGAIAADEWELAALGYRPTEHVFRERAHVMAVPRGENALLMSLEDFLAREATETKVLGLLREEVAR